MTSLADKVRKAAERLRNLNKDELINMLDKAGIDYEEIDSVSVVRITNVIKDFSAEEGRLLSPLFCTYGDIARWMENIHNNETHLKHYKKVSIGNDEVSSRISSFSVGYMRAENTPGRRGGLYIKETFGALKSHMAAVMLPKCQPVSLIFSDFNDAEHSQNHDSLEDAYYSLQKRGERVIPMGHEVMDFNFIANSGDREDERGILTH